MHRSFFPSKSRIIWASLNLALTISVGAMELGVPNPNGGTIKARAYSTDQKMDLRAVTIHFRGEKNAAKHCTVKTSSSLTRQIQKLAEAHWDDFQNTQTITLSAPTKARYLRLDFNDPAKADTKALFIREIDVE